MPGDAFSDLITPILPREAIARSRAICPVVDEITVPYVLGASPLETERDGVAPLADVLDRIETRKATPNVELAPFDKTERVLWQVKRSLGGPEVGQRVRDSLPTLEQAGPFCVGVALGMFDGAGDCVADRVKQIASGVSDLLQFYSLVFDAVLWRDLAAAWLDPGGPGVHDAMEDVRRLHPGVFEMLSNYWPLVDRLNKLVAEFNDDNPVSEVQPLTVAQQGASDWVALLAGTLAAILRPVLDQLVAAQGDPKGQGRIIGRVAGRVLLETVLLAMDLRALIRSASGLVVDVFEATRAVVTEEEIVAIGARADSVAPGVTNAGARIATAAEQETMRVYHSTAGVIEPYKLNKRKTYAFNQRIRSVYHLAPRDIEYIELRLDSHHIVKDAWYEPFKADWNRIGVNASDEMDATALHTTIHIRSGTKLAENLGLLGAEKEASLTAQLENFLKESQLDPLTRAAKPFKTLDEVVTAHAEFYKKFYGIGFLNKEGGRVSTVWTDLLEPHFTALLKKLRSVP